MEHMTKAGKTEKELKITFWLGENDFFQIDLFSILTKTEKAFLVESPLGKFWMPKNKENALAILGGRKEWYIHDEHDFLILCEEGIGHFLSAVNKKCSEWKMCQLTGAKLTGKTVTGELDAQWDGPDHGGFFHEKGKIKITVPASRTEKISDDTYLIEARLAEEKCRDWNQFAKRHKKSREGLCPVVGIANDREALRKQLVEDWGKVAGEAQKRRRMKKEEEAREFQERVVNSYFKELPQVFNKNEISDPKVVYFLQNQGLIKYLGRGKYEKVPA